MLSGAALAAPATGSADNGYDYRLKNSSKHVERGQKLRSGGCLFVSELSIAEKGAVEERELSRNDAVCERVIERGSPPEDVAAQDANATQPGELSGHGGAGVGADGRPVKRRPRVSGASHGGYDAKITGTAWWEDPLQIDVTRVSNTVEFAHWGGCVHNPWYSSWSDHWYSTSGWGLVSRNFDYSAQCSYVRSSNYGRYRNGSFCGTIDTYNTYSRNTIHGYPDGQGNHILNTWADGGCIPLLHANRRVTKWY